MISMRKQNFLGEDSMNTKQISSLTGARFFAILIIIVSHFEFLGDYIGPLYKKFFHNPTLGVDYFFLLSGFGMMLSFLRKDDTYPRQLRLRDLGHFAIQHIKKIYPFYLCALSVGVVFTVVTGFIDQGTAYLHDIDNMLIHLLPCLPLLQSCLGVSSFAQAFCGTFWFLSCLFCIYWVSLPLLRFFKKHLQTTGKAVIMFLLLTAVATALVYILKFVQDHSAFDRLVYASPYRRVFYVACGMVIGIIYSQHSSTRNTYWEYLAVPLACVYYFLRPYISTHYYISYSLDILICAFVLFSLATGTGYITKALSCKPLVYLGSLSMYVFIIHYLIRMYVHYIVNKLQLHSPLIVAVEMALIFFGGYGLSIALHRRMQRKAQRL